jgi:hypothetical protein
MVLVELHPNPGKFESMYRDRIDGLFQMLQGIPDVMRRNDKDYRSEGHEAMLTAIREMTELLLEHAAQRARGSVQSD